MKKTLVMFAVLVLAAAVGTALEPSSKLTFEVEEVRTAGGTPAVEPGEVAPAASRAGESLPPGEEPGTAMASASKSDLGDGAPAPMSSSGTFCPGGGWTVSKACTWTQLSGNLGICRWTCGIADPFYTEQDYMAVVGSAQCDCVVGDP